MSSILRQTAYPTVSFTNMEYRFTSQNATSVMDIYFIQGDNMFRPLSPGHHQVTSK